MILKVSRKRVNKKSRPYLSKEIKRRVAISQWHNGAIRDAYTYEPLKTSLVEGTEGTSGKKLTIDHIIPLNAGEKYFFEMTNLQAIDWYRNQQIKVDDLSRVHVQFEVLRRGDWIPGLETLQEKLELIAVKWKEKKQTVPGMFLPFWWYQKKLNLWGYDLITGRFDIPVNESYRREQQVKDLMYNRYWSMLESEGRTKNIKLNQQEYVA